MKTLVYTGVRDYLRGLPEDPRPEPTVLPVQVQSDVKEEVTEVYQYVPCSREEPESVEPSPEVVDKPQPERLRFDECTGFRGTEVLRALTQLLGDPVRVTGSHHIFRGPSGMKLPLAIHGAANVDPRALRDNIEAWGITEAWRSQVKQKLN